jgi:indolepyruvate ferredoxin oxidoreductase
VQAGALPISPASIERAIELNGVAVDQNIAAFRFGRQWAQTPDVVEALARITAPRVESLEQLIARLADDLVDYQNAAYAHRFTKLIDRVRSVEQQTGPGNALTEVVARNMHRLMAYKDEYEVARLALLDESQERYRAVGGADTTVTYHLHPPTLRSAGMGRKIKVKHTADPSFKALRVMKKVRGTLADPFRWAEVRKVEREMIPEYEAAVEILLAHLTSDRFDEAIEIAGLPDQVRGYEDLKLTRAATYRSELAERLAGFRSR